MGVLTAYSCAWWTVCVDCSQQRLNTAGQGMIGSLSVDPV